jgi:CubicO group peptidase (beta-lactamase class C family)
MDLRDAVDAVLLAATEAGRVPGVAAAVTDRDGVVHEAGFGVREIGTGTAMTADTVGWIASMTKAITGAAAMQLVEQGRLSLDEPAKEVCETIGRAQVIDGVDEGGAPRLRPPRTDITLRHLLTHTSGFVYDIWCAEMGEYMAANEIPGITTCRDAALELPLLFDPGERWYYGIGIDWAGKMVEAVSGQRLGDYLREHLFDPLGMSDTGFALTPSMAERRATVHARGEDGSLAPIEFALPELPEFEMGGGGLYSTVQDYCAFMRMILNSGASDAGDQVLQPTTVADMSTNQMGDLRVTALSTAMPAYSNDAEFFPGVPKSWGLTFQINEEDAPTGRPAGSLSWAGLANSYYWIDARNGVAGAYLTQILPFVDVESLAAYLDMETAVYEALHDTAPWAAS